MRHQREGNQGTHGNARQVEMLKEAVGFYTFISHGPALIKKELLDWVITTPFLHV